MSEPRSYSVETIGGETVTMTVRYEGKMESTGDTSAEVKRPRGEVHRIAISAPMSSTPTDAWQPPHPKDADGQRIQVTAHITEFNEVVERWQFSDTDVRWYRVERFGKKRVSVKTERRVPLG